MSSMSLKRAVLLKDELGGRIERGQPGSGSQDGRRLWPRPGMELAVTAPFSGTLARRTSSWCVCLCVCQNLGCISGAAGGEWICWDRGRAQGEKQDVSPLSGSEGIWERGSIARF